MAPTPIPIPLASPKHPVESGEFFCAGGGVMLAQWMSPVGRVEAVVDLLQPDRVAVELADHLGDARGVLAPVGADAAVHVIGRDAQAALGQLVRERLPVSEAVGLPAHRRHECGGSSS